jgi:hypothetical protein
MESPKYPSTLSLAEAWNIALATPIPPFMIAEPVVLLVASVTLLTVSTPAALIVAAVEEPIVQIP